MAKVRFIHKNVQMGVWNVQASLLKANGGTGFKAGMIASLTAEQEFGLAAGTAAPAFGVFQDNDYEVTGGYASGAGAIPAGTQASMKPTVMFGSGTILYAKPDAGETFADLAVGDAATFTRNAKVYADTANPGKWTVTATANGDAVGQVVQVPTNANGYELGVKLFI